MTCKRLLWFTLSGNRPRVASKIAAGDWAKNRPMAIFAVQTFSMMLMVMDIQNALPECWIIRHSLLLFGKILASAADGCFIDTDTTTFVNVRLRELLSVFAVFAENERPIRYLIAKFQYTHYSLLRYQTFSFRLLSVREKWQFLIT